MESNKEEKKERPKYYHLVRAVMFVLCALVWYGVYYMHQKDKDKMYCGEIKYKYVTQRDISHIVFYCDSLKRLIDITVSNQKYVNTDTTKHERVCYLLSDIEINR